MKEIEKNTTTSIDIAAQGMDMNIESILSVRTYRDSNPNEVRSFSEKTDESELAPNELNKQAIVREH
jgi:hypothetical protein